MKPLSGCGITKEIIKNPRTKTCEHYSRYRIECRTYEEVIAENPNAKFWIDRVGYVCDANELIQLVNEYDKKPTVELVLPNVLKPDLEFFLKEAFEEHTCDCENESDFPFSTEDLKPVQQALNELIEKNKELCTVYNATEEINIDGIYNAFK